MLHEASELLVSVAPFLISAVLLALGKLGPSPQVAQYCVADLVRPRGAAEIRGKEPGPALVFDRVVHSPGLPQTQVLEHKRRALDRVPDQHQLRSRFRLSDLELLNGHFFVPDQGRTLFLAFDLRTMENRQPGPARTQSSLTANLPSQRVSRSLLAERRR